MKDLIAKLQIDANCALGAIWMHIDAQAARIAELEAQIAAKSVPVVEPVAQPCWSNIAERLNKLDKAIAYSTNLTPDSKPRSLLYSILHEVCSADTSFLPSDTDKLREAIANISNNQITEVWESCGGVDGFYKSFGYQQFAHAILDLAADTVSSTALQAPVREVPEGWQLVPKEPTGVMKDAGAYALPVDYSSTSAAANAYRAMLAAAPVPQEGE